MNNLDTEARQILSRQSLAASSLIGPGATEDHSGAVLPVPMTTLIWRPRLPFACRTADLQISASECCSDLPQILSGGKSISS